MELTSDIVRRSAQQYDVELVHHAPLAGYGISRLGTALSPCKFLTVLDLRQNNLTTLDGISAVAETLTVLNAAENSITSIRDLEGCNELTTLYLEGNKLASASAAEPLSRLSSLRDCFFKRRVELDGDKNGLLLDNPFCSNKSEYDTVVRRILGHVLWVDGLMLRFGNDLSAMFIPSHPSDDPDFIKSAKNMGVVSSTAATATAGENAFRSIHISAEKAVKAVMEDQKKS